jgi:NADH pyrophosphatase NudC (nudix superfamily)
MIGFTARWASGELKPDEAEIVDPGWFAPDRLPAVPPKLSIARELIDDFVRRNTRPFRLAAGVARWPRPRRTAAR